MARTTLTLEERFMAHVEPEPNTGCWLWIASVDKNGYGWSWSDGIAMRAHRLAYKLFFRCGVDGLKVLHRCDVPSCVNPEHLFIGTQQQNLSDMARKKRGVTSRKGLPFGVRTCVNGTLFGAQVRYRGVRHHLGSYPTAAEAGAVAIAFKEHLLKAKEGA